MTKNVRTDMAMELKEDIASLPKGILCEEEQGKFETYITRIRVLDGEGAEAIGKPIGKYITVELPDMRSTELSHVEDVARLISGELQKILPRKEAMSALIVGLGNRAMTADALGSAVVDKVFVTRHIKSELPELLDKSTCSICAIAPGVLGDTGMETVEVVLGLVERIRPDVVIAIDALASRRTSRIGRSVQITDTGIEPGSGLGNRQKGLNRETLGVEVVSVGVPMVTYASTVAADLIGDIVDDAHADELIDAALAAENGDMVVMPKDIDIITDDSAELVATALNIALNPRTPLTDIREYMR